ncbi:MAG: hypothetical protein AAGN82_21890 [Myxococcota bacterium]
MKRSDLIDRRRVSAPALAMWPWISAAIGVCLFSAGSASAQTAPASPSAEPSSSSSAPPVEGEPDIQVTAAKPDRPSAATTSELATFRPACEGLDVISDWHPDEGIPPGYRAQTKIDKTWLYAGLGVAVAPIVYGPLVASSIGVEDPALQLIPFVGPFVLADRLSGEDGLSLLFVSTGVLQIGGALVALGAVIFPKQLLIRERFATGETEWSVAPWVSAERAGLNLVAAF